MKRLLMVAFHYPPASGTSGVQRALRFSEYLPEFGWKPIVLTATPRAYVHRSTDLAGNIPANTPVVRASAWDMRRHFAIAGRYPTRLSLPDRWWSWFFGAMPAGLAAIRRYRPHAIWSTFPIATAHWIGATLARFSGLPFIADFRDPMAGDGAPVDPRVWRSFARVERKAILAATASTFTTAGAVEMYRQRYPKLQSRIHLIENGYDEAVFAENPPPAEPLNSNKLTLLHSGIVYPSERDPRSLFAAVRSLRWSNPVKFSELIIRFRAPVHDQHLADLVRQYKIEDAVEIVPRVPYSEAIQEMQRADGLLILQASICNQQIPAKFYEYLRAGPPILLITDPAGSTAIAARTAGINVVADINDSASIELVLQKFLAGKVDNMFPRKSAVLEGTRWARTESLVEILETSIDR